MIWIIIFFIFPILIKLFLPPCLSYFLTKLFKTTPTEVIVSSVDILLVGLTSISIRRKNLNVTIKVARLVVNWRSLMSGGSYFLTLSVEDVIYHKTTRIEDANNDKKNLAGSSGDQSSSSSFEVILRAILSQVGIQLSGVSAVFELPRNQEMTLNFASMAINSTSSSVKTVSMELVDGNLALNMNTSSLDLSVLKWNAFEIDKGRYMTRDLEMSGKLKVPWAIMNDEASSIYQLGFRGNEITLQRRQESYGLWLQCHGLALEIIGSHRLSIDLFSLRSEKNYQEIDLSNILLTTVWSKELHLSPYLILSSKASFIRDSGAVICSLFSTNVWTEEHHSKSSLIYLEHLQLNEANKRILVKDLRASPSKQDIFNLLKLKSIFSSSKKKSSGGRNNLASNLFTLDLAKFSLNLCTADPTIVDLMLTSERCRVMKRRNSNLIEAKFSNLAIKDHLNDCSPIESVREVKLTKDGQRFHFSVPSKLILNWKPYVHKHIYDWIQDFFNTKPEIDQNNVVISSSSISDRSAIKFDVVISEILIKLHCDKTLMLISSKNLASIFKNADKTWVLNMPTFAIGLNHHEEIFKMTQMSISLLTRNNHFRKDFENRMDDSNLCLLVSMSTATIKIPYRFDIHDALVGDVIGHFKWVKNLVLRDKYPSGRVAPDIALFAKSISLELPDDSFEVSLRDNYELMEDEYFEALKREKCLKEKINELRASHILLPNTKIEELYNSLKKKNADIYVQRSRNLKTKAKKRTRLLEFSLNSMKFLILSDQSMHTKENLIDFILTTEKESRLPPNWEVSSFYLRWISFECKSAVIRLRDFPQPFMELSQVLLWGKSALAEQASVTREIRTQKIPLKHRGFEDAFVSRDLQSYKLFCDFAMDLSFLMISHGPCWEPVISQVSLTVSYLTGLKKRDPSAPLPWWDKMRYLIHGRLLWSVKILKMFFHTSLDPYNTTEEIEWNFSSARFQFIDSTIISCKAESLDIYARTASKYDDCRLIHIPKVELNYTFTWICMGDPKDHYAVILCTKDQVPEFSSNQSHDSFRSFRSNNVNVRVSVGVHKGSHHHYSKDHSTIHMFSSTIRWLESLKWLFSGTALPIRKGSWFGLEGQEEKKRSLFRHMKEVMLSLTFKELEIDYWTSATMTKGILVRVLRGLSLSGKYVLHIAPSDDGLIRRPKSIWKNEYTNCQLQDTDVWFQTSGFNEEGRFIEKNFFISVDNIQYDRKIKADIDFAKDEPFHHLIVNGAKCAWTTFNRDMTYSLYESWWRAHILREQLSADALRSVQVKNAKNQQETVIEPPPVVNMKKKENAHSAELSLTNLLMWKGTEVIDDNTDSAWSQSAAQDDHFSASSSGEESWAKAMCSRDDAVRLSWLIKFVNCQVLLRGSETQGYLILSASNAEARKQTHKPVWKADTLLSKTSWSGRLEDMQYFATISPNSFEEGLNEISWLPVQVMDDSSNLGFQSSIIDDGYGAVGSVLAQHGSEQLQRIVSKCKCEFYYVSYGDDPIEQTSLISSDDATWTENQLVNCFSLVHHDLDISTNSLQYSVIFDVLNNLLLFIDPATLNKTENYLRTKYKLMLSNIEDQRKPIIHLQSSLRQLICQLRRREKDIFHARNIDELEEASSDSTHSKIVEELEKEVTVLKEQVASKSEELNIRIRCYRDFQVSQKKKQALPFTDGKTDLRQRSDIYFSRAQWRLTETDGQLGIADVTIGNFSYTKSIMKDDSTEHLLEMGHILVKNLLKDQLYTNVLSPTTLQKNVPLDRQRSLRIFCREKAPVGGISVKDHFEINLVPLTIGVTQNFYKKLIAFCFPDRTITEVSGDPERLSRRSTDSLRKKTSSNFYVESPLRADDVEQMTERAKLNKLFVYIKIPEVPICVSFKGEKEKNKILDVANFLLQVPTIEYHNVTWTWLDFLMAVKSKVKDSLISQAIKQKLTIRSNTSKRDLQTVTLSDEEKAKMLLGGTLLISHKKK